MRRLRVNVPFEKFGMLVQQEIPDILRVISTLNDFDNLVSKITLRCNSCGYQLSNDEKKALITLQPSGKRIGSNLFGINSIKVNGCPKCNFSDATFYS